MNTEDQKNYFVKDRSGRDGSSQCNYKLLIELYGAEPIEDDETVKQWAEYAEVGAQVEVDSATIITRIN